MNAGAGSQSAWSLRLDRRLAKWRDIDADRINPERSGARGIERDGFRIGRPGPLASRALRLARMSGIG